ncbi:MAG: 6-phosphogluconolactonase [Fibrobacteria bacterium]|nr:6-phosphogluconolactonase [Fibrobacteria bacterium]
MPVTANVHVAKDLPELGHITMESIEGPVVAVSGGGTYESLFPFWRGSKVRNCLWLPVDERRVGLSEEGSNWMKTIRLLLDPNDISEQSTHWSLTAEGLADIASSLAGTGPEGVPVLDQIWLGMGEDGHTASLFPNGPELADTSSVALLTYAPKAPHPRVTLGMATLRAARRLHLVVTGAAKGPILRRVLDGDDTLPLSRVLDGLEVELFVDQACAEAANLTA